MITIYLTKMVAASAILFLLYRFVLEREKMLYFNRFFLLFSIVFSLALPFLAFEIPLTDASNDLPLVAMFSEKGTDYKDITPLVQQVKPIENTIDWTNIIWVLYSVVTLLLAVRFLINIWRIWNSTRHHLHIKKSTMQLVLVEQSIIPHSFSGFVFVAKAAYLNNSIEPEILAHEQAHIIQKHTWDVVFIEILLVVFWFNPVFWFYRKAILLNHEFLADDWVVSQYHNPINYQHLLLQKVAQNNSLSLSSPFNYLLTKKRFQMMATNTSGRRKRGLQLLSFLLIAGLLGILGDISFAQNPAPKIVKEAPSTKEGVSEAMLKEYKDLVEKQITRGTYTKGPYKGKKSIKVNLIAEPDRAKLEEIFLKMSKEQQEAQEFIMMPPLPPLPRTTPTQKEFEAYKNPRIYGIWIDEKKVPNTTLNKYKASDFSQYFVSKLYKNAQATIGFKYKFQVNLMTTPYYEKYRTQTLADKRYWLIVKD